MAEINNKVLLDLIAEMEKNATVDAQEAVLNEIVTNAKFLIPAVVTEIPPEEHKKYPEQQKKRSFLSEPNLRHHIVRSAGLKYACAYLPIRS